MENQEQPADPIAPEQVFWPWPPAVVVVEQVAISTKTKSVQCVCEWPEVWGENQWQSS